MEFSPTEFLGFVIGSLTTLIAAWLLGRRWFSGVREKAKNIVALAEKEAEMSAREIKAAAQIQFEKDRAESEKLLNSRQVALQEREKEMQRRRDEIDEEYSKMSLERERLDRFSSETHIERKKYEAYADTYRRKIQQATKVTQEEANQIFREEVLRGCSKEVQELRKEILLQSESEYKEESQRILVDTMQRLASSASNEISATVVQIPNEEMKGRIIGREGRNIKSFELATGTTLMIDETPGSILVSSFDPVRREVARLALERLVKDGRIHPASIEEAVNEISSEMKDNVIAIGEKGILKLRLTGIHPEVVSLLGKLYYRLSNNQNTLEHSIEVAFFCSLLASELGVDPELAKRAGLFHDMGKAIDHEYEGSHAVAAARILQRYGEDSKVCNAVAAHHNEVPEESVYAGILKIADGMSATRPGVRSDSMEGYIQRVKSLERIARSFSGVSDAYALQAGREIRVIVAPEKIDDHEAKTIARKIRVQIEEEIQYPGTIKISVIREQRFQDVAK